MSENEIIEHYHRAMVAIGADPVTDGHTRDTHAAREAIGNVGAAFQRACQTQPGLDAIRAVAGPGAVVVRVGTAVIVSQDRPTPGQLVARVLAAARSAIGASDGFNLVVFGREHRGLA